MLIVTTYSRDDDDDDVQRPSTGWSLKSEDNTTGEARRITNENS